MYGFPKGRRAQRSTKRVQGYLQGSEGYLKGSSARAQVHNVKILIFWVGGYIAGIIENKAFAGLG